MPIKVYVWASKTTFSLISVTAITINSDIIIQEYRIAKYVPKLTPEVARATTKYFKNTAVKRKPVTSSTMGY